jgi:AraC-like DNA-binding protein
VVTGRELSGQLLATLSTMCQFMSMNGQIYFGHDWATLEDGSALGPPRPVMLRALSVPARHYFPEHSHHWNQLVYAISGVLIVAVEGSCFVVPPEQAVWLPTGIRHSVGSLFGAEFRSLYIADTPAPNVAKVCTVIAVPPLLRALIIEAAAIEQPAGKRDSGYGKRVTTLIIDQLRRAEAVGSALPWPRQGPLMSLCEALYANPDDERSAGEWGVKLGMSARTLTRRFASETGLSMRAWRRRLRLFKAVELLAGETSITEIALELGYASTSAFIYMFRKEMGRSPLVHRRSSRS